MQKVLVYTLTRDRLEYTKRMFKQLKNCGVKYDHVVLDNGSKDGTPEWLEKQNLKITICEEENTGLWKAIQTIKDTTRNFLGYDYVIKIDNDMEFPEDNWLKKLIGEYERNNFDVLSPFVEGVCDGKGGPDRLYEENGIGVTFHVGGAALLTKPEYYDEDLPTDKPKAQGWDTWFCTGLKCGIVENIHVRHDTKEQEKTMPKYYARKIKESKII